MKYLLVDDSPTTRNIVMSIFSTLPGIEFAEAGDGVEALALMASTVERFDVVIVDWNMPNMDGITLVKKIRETDRETVIIIITTESEKNHVLEGVIAGANNFVVKPFTAELLMKKISQALVKAKAKVAYSP